MRHSKLSALLEVHVGHSFEVASDMLTRLTERDDIAPDVSVFPAARDPETGGRQLEQLVFEVVSTQTLADVARKASKLTARGVRRIFAVDVERARAFEWSVDLGTWGLLAEGALIDDPALAVPLPVAALVQSAKVDDVLASALLAKRNAVIAAALEQGRSEAKREGKAEGKAEALLAVLAVRGLSITEQERRRIVRAEAELVDGWLLRAVTCRSVGELLGG
jgi:hypothetical protein